MMYDEPFVGQGPISWVVLVRLDPVAQLMRWVLTVIVDPMTWRKRRALPTI